MYLLRTPYYIQLMDQDPVTYSVQVRIHARN